MTIYEKINKIQTQLNAPKSQYNKFGGYKYHNCEDILQALKPLLSDIQCYVTLSDEIVAIGNRIYVKATAVISDGKDSVTTTAFARESETRKGMDDSQITGSASSYARKYALNGLFAIDDNKDADFDNHANNNHANNNHASQHSQKSLPSLNDSRFNQAIEAVKSGQFDKRRLLTEFALTDQQRHIAKGA